MLVGGIAENFDGSYRIGGGRDFVIEGDEYDSAFFDKTAKFLKYLPDIAVVNNIEFDHADIYADLDAIRLAFRRFVNLVPRRGLLLLGADNRRCDGACEAERTAGSRRSGSPTARDWQAHDLDGDAARRRRLACAAAVRRLARSRCRCSALTTCGTRSPRLPSGAAVGLSTDTMAASLKRSRACAAGCSIAAPRAASPSTTTSRIIRRRSPRRWRACGRHIPDRRIWAIFEPRSATSCRRVFQADFARAFADGRSSDPAGRCSGRRCPRPSASRPKLLVADLEAAGVNARYIPTYRRHRRRRRTRERATAISWS